jgi:glycosyltransferase involved in cell wall biosynthesis
MPAYNASATIGRSIESVLGQTFADWELVIIDDGSHDDTLKTAQSYAERDERIRVHSGPHRGLVGARSESMRQACGELFARLDSDDEMLPEYLSRIDAIFREHPDAQIVSTNGYQALPDGRLVEYYRDPVFQKVSSLTVTDMLSGHLFGTSTVMSRDVYELTGGPREGARSEDIDLWFRALAHGAVHYHLPEPVFLYHQSAESMSKNAAAVWRSHIEILENLISTGLLSPSDVELARKAIRRYRLRLAVRWDLWGTPLRRFATGVR